jgi:hypothetical protein
MIHAPPPAVNGQIALLDVPSLLDWLWGWSLYLPRDLTLLAVVFATIGLLLLARRNLNAQDRLRRVQRDLVQLRMLRRVAREADDREALPRLQATAMQLKLIQVRADLIVLAWVLVPLGLLAWWASARLQYLPLQTGAEFSIVASYPASSVERLTYLVPTEGCELLTPALQRVALDGEVGGVVEVQWRVRVTATDSREVRLAIHHLGRHVEHPVRLLSPWYREATIVHPHGGVLATHVSLPPYRFLGWLPGFEAWGISSWMLAYLGLSLLLMPLARRWWQIA